MRKQKLQKEITGVFTANMRGFGFISMPDGEEDVYVPAGKVNGAMHGDTVKARLIAPPPRHYDEYGAEPARTEAEITAVLTRARAEIVGTYTSGRGFGFVTPDDTRYTNDIFVRTAQARKATTGMKVVVEITTWPNKNQRAEGKITEILGKSDAPGVDVLSIMRRYDLKEEFPAAVRKAARKVKNTIPPAEYKNRTDRRDLPIVTIDGKDAKDLDDGVYAERLPEGGYRLGVYIADVSWYVRENSPLDKEARERGTSVYLVDRVVPMLPKELSNGICSLNAGEDRLAMACEMEFTPRGRLTRYEIFPTIICVYRRLTYSLVNKILVKKDSAFVADNQDILPHLETLADLRRILKSKHARKGAIDFSLPEINVNLDAMGHPVGLYRRHSGLAESIIEECMLAANETVAEHLAKHKIPGLYRVHEPPTTEKTERLNTLLSLFGLYLPVRQRGVRPKDVQQVLKQVSGRPEERLISMVSLRSMQQARYAARNLGHFGLAAKYYTHFTSPIRRYPDLIVHRMLRGTVDTERRAELKTLLSEIADLASSRERRAVDAERETADLKQAEYMQNFIGQEFDGIISGVTNFGLFVELDNGVEGMVHVRDIDWDYYEYVPGRFALIGEHSRRRFMLGDEVKVVVDGVNLTERKINLRIISEAKTERKKKHNKNKHGAKKSKDGKRVKMKERRMNHGEEE